MQLPFDPTLSCPSSPKSGCAACEMVKRMFVRKKNLQFGYLAILRITNLQTPKIPKGHPKMAGIENPPKTTPTLVVLYPPLKVKSKRPWSYRPKRPNTKEVVQPSMFEREHASFIYSKEGIKPKTKESTSDLFVSSCSTSICPFLACDFAEKPQKRAFPSVKIMGLIEGVNPSDFCSAKKSAGCCHVYLHTWIFQEDQQIHVHSSCDVAPFFGLLLRKSPFKFLRDSHHLHICSERSSISMSLSICHHLLTGPVRRW